MYWSPLPFAIGLQRDYKTKEQYLPIFTDEHLAQEALEGNDALVDETIVRFDDPKKIHDVLLAFSAKGLKYVAHDPVTKPDAGRVWRVFTIEDALRLYDPAS